MYRYRLQCGVTNYTVHVYLSVWNTEHVQSHGTNDDEVLGDSLDQVTAIHIGLSTGGGVAICCHCPNCQSVPSLHTFSLHPTEMLPDNCTKDAAPSLMCGH